MFAILNGFESTGLANIGFNIKPNNIINNIRFLILPYKVVSIYICYCVN